MSGLQFSCDRCGETVPLRVMSDAGAVALLPGQRVETRLTVAKADGRCACGIVPAVVVDLVAEYHP